MRVGVQGRAIVGPAGAPSQVNVPIRYAVVQEGVEPKTIVTKFRRLPVALAAGNTNDVHGYRGRPELPDAAAAAIWRTMSSMSASTKPATGSSRRPRRKRAKAQAQPKPQKKLERSVLPEYR